MGKHSCLTKLQKQKRLSSQSRQPQTVCEGGMLQTVGVSLISNNATHPTGLKAEGVYYWLERMASQSAFTYMRVEFGD